MAKLLALFGSVPSEIAQLVEVHVSAGQYNSMALKADALSPVNLHPSSRWIADTLSGSDGSTVSNWIDVVGAKSATQGSAGQEGGVRHAAGKEFPGRHQTIELQREFGTLIPHRREPKRSGDPRLFEPCPKWRFMRGQTG